MTLRLFRDSRHLSLTVSALAFAAAGIAGCNRSSTGPEGQATQTAVANPCGSLAPDKTSTLPVDPGSNQQEVDCAAWQAFISLNWRADPNNNGQPDPTATWADFGSPTEKKPAVWETYLEAVDVFDHKIKLEGMWVERRAPVKMLSRISKFGNLDLTDITQAGAGDRWLTSQRRDVTYYEVMMNQDEFEFISQKDFDLTTAAGQLACATQPGKPVSDGPPIKPPYPPGTVLRGGLNFPAGSANGWDDTDCAGNTRAFGKGVGAIEVKAAWIPLPADHSLDYRYKTAQADIVDPKTHAKRSVTVGLVGLHIARKRFPRLPWVWATFEHIDNSPDEGPNGGFTAPQLPANSNRKPSPGYTYFNASCDPQKDPVYRCRHNFPPVPCGAGGICMPYDAPMQITRLNPVGPAANKVTAYVWSLLPAQSVFNYYRLVDVQWPQTGIGKAPPGPGLRVPLTMGDPLPKGSAGGVTQIVANTTLESFQQGSNSCMDCHANFASIASSNQLLGATASPTGLRKLLKTPPPGGQAPYASDYSFLFLSETKR